MDVLFNYTTGNDLIVHRARFHKAVGMLSLAIGLFDADKLVSAVGRELQCNSTLDVFVGRRYE